MHGAMLERDGELARVHELIDGARRGSGRLVLIEAPAGIGKTRLHRVRLQRRGTVLRVSWRKARGALRYAVTLRLRDGRVRTVIVRRTSASLTPVPRTEPGQIMITAIGNDRRQGPVVRARFRATKKPRTILRPLR